MSLLTWIAKQPWRKPLVVTVTLVSLLAVGRSVYMGEDIPPNTASFMQALAGVVLIGYFGSSAYEACHHRAEEGKEDDENV
jgi:hypothetical protein